MSEPATTERPVERLAALYAMVPATRCRETKCAEECCSRLALCGEPERAFVSLPLVYAVEYHNIRQYVERTFEPDARQAGFATERDSRTCIFFDRERLRCRIYPARPFSCRLFGFALPDILWGIDLPPGSTAPIYCPDMEVVERGKVSEFRATFGRMWESLARWSIEQPVLTAEQCAIVERHIGLKDIPLCGWIEFNRLAGADLRWFETGFPGFWQRHGGIF